LTFLYLTCRGSRDPQLLLAMQLFFFPQGRIFQRAFPGWQCAAVSAMHHPVGMQDFQIFPDRDLGSIEFPGHIGHQHTTVPLQNLDNGSPSFFVEHVRPGTSAYDCPSFLYRLLSVVQSKSRVERDDRETKQADKSEEYSGSAQAKIQIRGKPQRKRGNFPEGWQHDGGKRASYVAHTNVKSVYMYKAFSSY